MHQQLVLWTARKMASDGFTVYGVDGWTGDGALWSLPRPFLLDGVRPDVVGRRADGALGFGEAKTSGDVASIHTLLQLERIGRAIRDGIRGLVYLAVPRSAARSLDGVLARAGLLGVPHVVRLHVPDALLGNLDDR